MYCTCKRLACVMMQCLFPLADRSRRLSNECHCSIGESPSIIPHFKVMFQGTYHELWRWELLNRRTANKIWFLKHSASNDAHHLVGNCQVLITNDMNWVLRNNCFQNVNYEEFSCDTSNKDILRDHISEGCPSHDEIKVCDAASFMVY